MQSPADFQAARSFDAALDGLAEATLALGFDAVDYGQIPRPFAQDGGYNAPQIVSRHFPPRWHRGWDRYSRIDPFLCGAYPRTWPLDWSEVRGAGWLSAPQRQAIDYIAELGFVDGVTVPMHLPSGGFAFVSALSRSGAGPWRAQAEASRARLFVLAHRFHATVTQRFGFRADAVPVHLSPREREVLCHAAAGRSAPQTAALLKRSVETVRRQRKSAMARLGARSMAQAVARALNLGAMSLGE